MILSKIGIASPYSLCYNNTAVCGSISSEDENIELIMKIFIER